MIGSDSVSFRADILDDAAYYCFEATDADGNKTYIEASPGIAGRILVEFQTADSVLHASGESGGLTDFTPRFYSTSGHVDWIISGPSRSKSCNATVFTDANKDPKLSFREDKRNEVVKYSDSFTDAPSLAGVWVYNNLRVREGSPGAYSYKPGILWSGQRKNKNRENYCIRATDQLGYKYYRLFNAADPSVY